MKHFFIFLFWIPLTSFSQIRVDSKGNKLYGQIKKLVEYQYSLFADSNRNRIPDQTGIYSYNEETKQEYVYYYWGNDSAHIHYKTIFSFNENDSLVAQEHYTENELDSKIDYKYDKNNRLIEEESSVHFKSKTKYQYDSVGNKISDNICNSQPCCEKRIYIYDANNHATEIDIYKCDTLHSKKITTYDSAYHYSVTEFKQIGFDKKNKTIYRYDDKMNLIEQITYSKSDNRKSKLQEKGLHINNKYKYDSEGNWVERIYYLYGRKDTYMKRVITYY